MGFDINKISSYVVAVGAVNVGLEKFVNFNLIDTIAGFVPTMPVIKDVLVGVVLAAGVYKLGKLTNLIK